MIRVGIVGCGGIVKQYLQAMPFVEGMVCEALQVREPRLDYARQLANEHGISRVYTDYSTMLGDENIDAVYIGIINSLHYAYAKEALLAGKHVICEKPFTSTYAEAAELAELARAKNVFLFEAITVLHSPNFFELQQRLGSIGTPRMVQCNYSQYSSRYTAYRAGEVLPAFDPSLSGGALYDINIYNLHFTVGLFGLPDDVRYFANKGFNGIDTSGVVVMKYPDFTAICTGAKDSGSPGFMTVQGEDGFLSIHGAAYLTETLEVKTATEQWERNFHAASHYMVEEFSDFARVIHTKDRATHDLWLQHSLNVMRVAESARKDAGIVFGADSKI